MILTPAVSCDMPCIRCRDVRVFSAEWSHRCWRSQQWCTVCGEHWWTSSVVNNTTSTDLRTGSLYLTLSILVIVDITSSLQKPLHTAVIVLEKDNTPFSYLTLNSHSLETVSSIDVCLNLDDCILYYSLMHYCKLCAHWLLSLHSILCIWFYLFLFLLNIVTACTWHVR